MKLTFLGTGTSHGIPVINCSCRVCDSARQGGKNCRRRCSVLIEAEGNHILIDTSMDFRQQMLDYEVTEIDAVLFTHEHADHIFGLPDIRSYTQSREVPLPFYASHQTVEYLRRSFSYIFNPTQIGGGIPEISLNLIHGPFDIDGLEITPVPVKHGIMDVYGFRIGKIAYIPDVSAIPEDSRPILADLDILVVDALRPEKHPTHFSLDESIEMTKILQPRRSYFTHMCHKIDHYDVDLPEGVELAWDGLVIEF